MCEWMVWMSFNKRPAHLQLDAEDPLFELWTESSDPELLLLSRRMGLAPCCIASL